MQLKETEIDIYFNNELLVSNFEKERKLAITLETSSINYNFDSRINNFFSSQSVTVKDGQKGTVSTEISQTKCFYEFENLVKEISNEEYTYVTLDEKKYSEIGYVNLSNSPFYILLTDKKTQEKYQIFFSEARYSLQEYDFNSPREFYQLPPETNDLGYFSKLLYLFDKIYKEEGISFHKVNMKFESEQLKDLSMNEEMIKIISILIDMNRLVLHDSKIDIDYHHTVFLGIKKLNNSNLNYFNPISITESILPNI